MSNKDAPKARLPRNVLALGAVSFLMDASTEMIRPIFPLLLKNVLGAPIELIGLIEGIAESASSLLKMAAGWLSDKLGKRKPLIAFGYGASAVAKPLIALAGSAWTVLAIWLLDRTGKGVRGAPRDAIIADSTPEGMRGRAYGLHRAMDTAGAVAGPLLAMALLWFAGRHKWGPSQTYRGVFWLAAVPGILSVLVALAFVREKARVGHKAPKGAKEAVTDGRFTPLMVVLGLFALGNSADAFLFLRSDSLGVATVLLPALYMVMNIVTASTSHWFGSLSDRIGRRPLVIGGFLIYAVVYAGLALAPSKHFLWPLFAIYGIYYGMTDGTIRALVADIVPARSRGTAFGIYQGVVGAMALPASFLMGLLYRHAGGYAFFLGSGLAFVAAIGVAKVVPPKAAAAVAEGNDEKCEG